MELLKSFDFVVGWSFLSEGICRKTIHVEVTESFFKTSCFDVVVNKNQLSANWFEGFKFAENAESRGLVAMSAGDDSDFWARL